MREEAKRWWSLAKDDLEKAEILFKNKKYDGAAFFCQQSVEKALKALLIEKTKKLRKIRDLVALGKDVNLPEELLKEVKELTFAYIYSRYPDIKPLNNLHNIVSVFLDVSKKVLKWVKSQLLNN